MAHIGGMQDALVNNGFTVLCYDRLGVGFSEPNQRGVAPSVEECISEMHELMEHVLPPETKWILLGPSMGSLVAQCFISSHPEKVCGFLNLDGFPAPFSAKRKKFLESAFIYFVFSFLAHLGYTRAIIHFLKNNFETTSIFTGDVIAAIMNRPSFWRNTSYEFTLMMDLAQEASQKWGSLDVLKMTQNHQKILSSCKPFNNGDFIEGKWIPLERSKVEIGTLWGTQEDRENLETWIEGRISDSPLGLELSRMPVRIMSARDYNYFGGDSFYDGDMKFWAACEHQLQEMVGKMGKRYVFPRIGHDTLHQKKTSHLSMCHRNLGTIRTTKPETIN